MAMVNESAGASGADISLAHVCAQIRALEQKIDSNFGAVRALESAGAERLVDHMERVCEQDVRLTVIEGDVNALRESLDRLGVYVVLIVCVSASCLAVLMLSAGLKLVSW